MFTDIIYILIIWFVNNEYDLLISEKSMCLSWITTHSMFCVTNEEKSAQKKWMAKIETLLHVQKRWKGNKHLCNIQSITFVFDIVHKFICVKSSKIYQTLIVHKFLLKFIFIAFTFMLLINWGTFEVLMKIIKIDR